jgi:hypothetical protein
VLVENRGIRERIKRRRITRARCGIAELDEVPA